MGKKDLARIEQGSTASSVAYGCAALLDAGLEQQLGPAATDEEGLAAGGQLAVRIAHRIDLLRHQIDVSHEALERISDELRQWRRRRDRANGRLYDQAKALRELCRGVFAKGQGDEFLGLHGSLPREPKELYSTFGATVRRLADDAWPTPEKSLISWNLNRPKIVESLLKAHKELGQALAAIQEGETRQAVAKAGHKRAKEAHKVFLAKSTRYLEAALDLAGLADLVATVRPGVGRRGRPMKAELAGLPAERKALPVAADAAPQARLSPVSASESAEGSLPATPDEPEDPT